MNQNRFKKIYIYIKNPTEGSQHILNLEMILLELPLETPGIKPNSDNQSTDSSRRVS